MAKPIMARQATSGQATSGERVSARSAAFEYKKDLILRIAAEQFFEKGYVGTRIEDIAQALQASPPFIYYHYPSKLDLLAAVCRRTSVLTAELAEAALDPASGADIVGRFRGFVRAFVLRLIEERKFMAILFSEAKHLPQESRARMREDRRRFHLALGRLLEEGRAAGAFRFADLSVANQTVTGMMTWIFNWYRPDGEHSPDALAGIMEDMVLAALGAPPPAGRS